MNPTHRTTPHVRVSRALLGEQVLVVNVSSVSPGNSPMLRVLVASVASLAKQGVGECVYSAPMAQQQMQATLLAHPANQGAPVLEGFATTALLGPSPHYNKRHVKPVEAKVHRYSQQMEEVAHHAVQVTR